MSATTVLVSPSLSQGLFLGVNEFARVTPWLHTPMALFAKLGVLSFVILTLAAWWKARTLGTATMARALLVPVATLGAVSLQQIVDIAVNEPRPYDVLPGVLVLVGRSTDPSFPSDHACLAGAAAAALFLVDRRIGVVAWASALLMAVARVYVGAHWPIDVLAGLAFGAIVALAIVWILGALARRIVSRLEHSTLRRLVTAAPSGAGSGFAQVPLLSVHTPTREQECS